MKKILFIFCMLCVLLIAANASADSITFQLTVPNTGLNPYPAPYADVTVNRTSITAATITFNAIDSAQPGAFSYYIGGAQATDVNVNANSFSVSNLTGFVVRVNPPFPNIGSGTADGFGNFNLTIDNFDGATSASTSDISFKLTNTDISGTWASASDVLTPNANNYLAAAHIYVTGGPDDFTLGNSPPTGFAANGTPIPEPATMLLLGSGLLGMGVYARRRFSKK